MTDYIPHTPAQEQAMCALLGIANPDDLIQEIPDSIRLAHPLSLPAAIDEDQLQRELDRRGAAYPKPCFLGAGAYDHQIPAVVRAVTSRPEFFTAYTPYQPELSQGTLQSIFEFQTLVCRLLAMDLANASHYDGATALAEAVAMACDVSRRERVLVSRAVHPHYRQVLASYGAPRGLELVELPVPQGVTAVAAVQQEQPGKAACVVIQNPNFFGQIEDGPRWRQLAQQLDTLLLVVVGDPLSLGLLAPPGAYGADLVVGEGQSLGNPPYLGGSTLGLMAVKQRFLRRIPGRVVGQTVDRRGRRGFVLTLQAREQHIRRERAVSNICSNQALNALAATVYLSWLGPQGLAEVARACWSRAHLAYRRLLQVPGVQPVFDGPFWHEFVVRLPGPMAGILDRCRQQGITGGLPLGEYYPELEECMMVCVTERRTIADVERLAAALEGN